MSKVTGFIIIEPVEPQNVEKIEYVLNNYVFPENNFVFDQFNTAVINAEVDGETFHDELLNLTRYWLDDLYQVRLRRIDDSMRRTVEPDSIIDYAVDTHGPLTVSAKA